MALNWNNLLRTLMQHDFNMDNPKEHRHHRLQCTLRPHLPLVPCTLDNTPCTFHLFRVPYLLHHGPFTAGTHHIQLLSPVTSITTATDQKDIQQTHVFDRSKPPYVIGHHLPGDARRNYTFNVYITSTLRVKLCNT